MTGSVIGDVSDWLDRRRNAAQLSVEPVTWGACQGWSFQDGALVHESGGYFSVVGVELTSPHAEISGYNSLMIDQPEIGILGFVLREGPNGIQWLVQAKSEPGNVGGVQAAPTVQATYSNFTRRHGGAATAYLANMLPEGVVPNSVVDVRQSEQGGMFFNKFNRNVCAFLDCSEADDRWRWCDTSELRGLLRQNHAINSDARSVVVCTPWRYLSDANEPFAVRASTWEGLLHESYFDVDPSGALAWLEEKRMKSEFAARRIPIDSITGCVIAETEIAHPALGRVVKPYIVEAADREVLRWAQPLMGRARQEIATLVCARRNGALKFYLRGSVEAGFVNRVQFGPSLQSDSLRPAPGWIRPALAATSTRLHADLVQSDEGGRFMTCVTRYQIAEIEDRYAQDDDEGYWVGLGVIERLAMLSGALTNEARTLASLLVSWT